MEREREMEMVLEIGREKSLGRCIKISEDDIFYIARVLFPFLFLFCSLPPDVTRCNDTLAIIHQEKKKSQL